MIVDYWLLARLGQVWLRIRPGLRPALGEMPAVCDAVARGEPVPAARLLRAQQFGFGVWWVFGLCALIMNFPLLAVLAAVHPGPVGRNAGVGVMVFLVLLMAIAMAQIIMLWFRANRAKWFLLRHPGDFERPLPHGSPGLPRSADFWLASTAAVIFFTIMLFASGAA